MIVLAACTVVFVVLAAMSGKWWWYLTIGALFAFHVVRISRQVAGGAPSRRSTDNPELEIEQRRLPGHDGRGHIDDLRSQRGRHPVRRAPCASRTAACTALLVATAPRPASGAALPDRLARSTACRRFSACVPIRT